jgi:hypothetical protein
MNMGAIQPIISDDSNTPKPVAKDVFEVKPERKV